MLLKDLIEKEKPFERNVILPDVLCGVIVCMNTAPNYPIIPVSKLLHNHLCLLCEYALISASRINCTFPLKTAFPNFNPNFFHHYCMHLKKKQKKNLYQRKKCKNLRFKTAANNSLNVHFTITVT